jgi:hypothetical protein
MVEKLTWRRRRRFQNVLIVTTEREKRAYGSHEAETWQKMATTVVFFSKKVRVFILRKKRIDLIQKKTGEGSISN